MSELDDRAGTLGMGVTMSDEVTISDDMACQRPHNVKSWRGAVLA